MDSSSFDSILIFNNNPFPNGTVAGTGSQSTKIECPPPVITNFLPNTSSAGSVVTITGKYLETTTGVTINSIKVTTGLVKNNDGTKVSVTVPKVTTDTVFSKPIIVSTQYGTTTSNKNFNYLP
jgi:hypothetical protein